MIKRFEARCCDSKFRGEWEITSEILVDANGKQFVWAKQVSTPRRGKLHRETPWHLPLLWQQIPIATPSVGVA